MTIGINFYSEILIPPIQINFADINDLNGWYQ